MDGVALDGLIDGIVGVPEECADRLRLQVLLADVRRLKSWCEGREVWLAHRLQDTSATAEFEIAEATTTTLGAAMKLVERAATIAELPVFAEALDAGVVTGAHVDVLTRARRDLPPDRQDAFTGEVQRLVVGRRRRRRRCSLSGCGRWCAGCKTMAARPCWAASSAPCGSTCGLIRCRGWAVCAASSTL